MRTRILLVDGHVQYRQSVRTWLDSEPTLEVVAEVPDGAAAVECVRTLKPDVVLMDVRLPVLNGIEATRQIVAVSPTVKVIGLSLYSNWRFVEGMLAAGAWGYIAKDTDPKEIVRAIKVVISGEIYLSTK